MFGERQEAEAELERHRHFSRINAAGLAFHGKDWKWLDPNEPQMLDDFEERESAALKRMAERRQRKAEA